MTDEILDETRRSELQARTRDLPREIMPPADAWAAIQTRIAESGGTAESGETAGVAENAGFQSRSQAGRSPAFWQGPVFLAAAAAMLVAGSSIVTAVALGGRDAPVRDGSVASSEGPRRPLSAPATLAEFTVVENDYIGTANRLAEILESDDSQLSPETIVKLKESLRVIDAAILEARRALAADPANRELVEMLSASYNHKLDLLRRTTEMGRS